MRPFSLRSSAHPPTQSLSEYRDTYGECFGTAIYALTIYGGPAVLFAIRPDVDKCIDLEFLSVSRQYARRGIGGNLIKMALEVRDISGIITTVEKMYVVTYVQ